MSIKKVTMGIILDRIE